MALNEDEGQTQNIKDVTVRQKPTSNDDMNIYEHHHRHKQQQQLSSRDDYSRASSLASRPLSDYSCRPNDIDDENYDKPDNRHRTKSPICPIF